MCDERERLIEYLYGEAGADDRRAIETHLERCPTCRHEVNGLRGVRDDLLAWDVPDHEPIWRPVVPAPVAAPRRVLPAWALAAAASVLFAMGIAGGMLASGGWPGSPPAAAESRTAEAVAPATPQLTRAVTPDDLARLEADIVERLRAEMDQKVQTVASQVSRPSPLVERAASRAADPDLARRVAILEGWMDDQISLNAIFNGNFGRLNNRTASLSQELELSRLRQVSLESPAQ